MTTLAAPKLAVNGGSPVRTRPWTFGPAISRDMIGDAEREAVLRVLDRRELFRFEHADVYNAAYNPGGTNVLTFTSDIASNVSYSAVDYCNAGSTYTGSYGFAYDGYTTRPGWPATPAP